MRIAELSRRTGVTKATIKYYIRERLVPPGEPAGRNQASYTERHERRIRLVRALMDSGGLSIATTRDALAHIDDPERNLDGILGRVLNTPVASPRPSTGPPADESLAAADDLIRRRSWQCDNQYVRDALAATIDAFHKLGKEDLLEVLDTYADAAERIAMADMEVISRRADTESAVDDAVVGTVLGGALLLALRRCAHVDASARQLRRRRDRPAP
jgi:DNA-binding transcriptional MerR regulator